MVMKISIVAVSTVFALFCSAINWHHLTITEKPNGITRMNMDGASVVLVLCIILLTFLTLSIYKTIRICLDQQIRIPKSMKFINSEPCLLLIPMILISWNSSNSTTSAEGVLKTVSYGYGSTLSLYAAVAAALTVLAYQLAVGIYPYRRHASQV
jgi:hypothetical protein